MEAACGGKRRGREKTKTEEKEIEEKRVARTPRRPLRC